jgi:hypothetical protein
MPAKPTHVNFDKLIQDGGAKLNYKITSTEDSEEKRVRLLKERWNFFVKEIGPYVVAGLLVLAISAYCFVVLGHSASQPEDKQWAKGTLSAIAVGVGGVIFGKATR